MEVLNILEQLKSIGINEISEYTLKDFFVQRDYIHTTGKEIKECALKVGIKLKPCNAIIPENLFTIDKRGYKEAIKVKQKIYYASRKLTKEILEDLYVNKKMTQVDIAEKFGIARVTVHDSLMKFEILVRSTSLSQSGLEMRKDLEKIKEMHKNGIALKDIAKQYNCVISTLSKYLTSVGYDACKENKRWKNERTKKANK